MKVFLWFVGFAYVFLYFYAAWIYEGFDMWLAILIFATVTGLIIYSRKRSARRAAAENEHAAEAGSDVIQSEPAAPLSLWRSPLPYMVMLLAGIIIGSMLLI
ncbi:hypothetical protein [Alteromonas facilis]|uniref:hypothetical protein n=1 Tax=Alteromonas facilis TaxID=2048004 RepID=UPI000C2873BF|nr:hypothetical protein [Alteromonas facilis]